MGRGACGRPCGGIAYGTTDGCTYCAPYIQGAQCGLGPRGSMCCMHAELVALAGCAASKIEGGVPVQLTAVLVVVLESGLRSLAALPVGSQADH